MNSQTQTVPTHLGLILDGNRRWARANGKTAIQGHRQGYENLKTVTRAALKYGVRYVSAYIFSTENWKRDRQEVHDIMRLLKWVLKHEVNGFHKDGIRLRFIGSKAKLGTAVLTAIHDAEKMTEDNTRGTLLLCLDYGGQQEIVDAVKRIAETGVDPSEITSGLIDRFLYAPDVPPVDLIIRTSGEQRLSNFLMWQSVYSELAFTKKNWPEFSEKDLVQAIKHYSQLQRRFGK
jgi:undecaprenyl diphosphate synthase